MYYSNMEAAKIRESDDETEIEIALDFKIEIGPVALQKLIFNRKKLVFNSASWFVISVCAMCAGAVFHPNWWTLWRYCFKFISIILIIAFVEVWRADAIGDRQYTETGGQIKKPTLKNSLICLASWFVISVCAMCAGAVFLPNWWPLWRDCFYATSITIIIGIGEAWRARQRVPAATGAGQSTEMAEQTKESTLQDLHTPLSKAYDDDITPEEDLINIIKSSDSEKEELAKNRRPFEKVPKPDINLQDEGNDTPSYIAASKGECEVVKYGAKINVKNSKDRTPLEPSLPSSVRKQSANQQQFQENHNSLSSNGQEYNIQSSYQPRKLISKQNSEKFNIQKRQGTTGGLDGYFYEIDLLILGRLRGQRDTDKFYLTTNKDGLGAFDDIVFRYWSEKKSTIILLQANHVDNPKKGKVTIEKFMNPYYKFYLGKYFSDYLNNKEKFKESSDDVFFQGNLPGLDLKNIIYTNAILDERFDKDRITDIDDGIFSTKFKEDKAFKFSVDDINSDVIKMLENVCCQERVKLLAKAVVSCISGNLNYITMMGDKFISTYHVFLAKNVIDVGKDIKEVKKNIRYREGKINYNFLNIDSNNLLEKELKNEIMYEYAKNVVFSNKLSSGLENRSDLVCLVNKVIKLLKLSKKMDEDVIEKIGGSAIILDTKNRKLIFANQEKLQDEYAKQFIKDLEHNVGNLADYEFDIPYELVKKTLKQQTEKEPLKLHVSFGNVSPNFKKPENLIKKFIELFEKNKSRKIITIDDSVVGHGKELIKNIGKLVGSLLVFEEKDKMLRFAREENLDENALNLIKELKKTAQQHDLEVDSYRFDIKVMSFPRDILFIDDEDRTNVKEFLSKLEVFTGQASDLELKEIIKDEIRNLYKLTEEEVEDSFLKIRNKAQEYWRESVNYLKKDDDFFADIVKFNIAFNVRHAVALFTGRERELNDLHRKMQLSSEKRAVVSQMTSICGLGGIGKTTLCRRYIQQYGKTCYDNNIVWLNAEDYTTLTQLFYRLAEDKLGISTKNASGEKKDIKSIVQEVYVFFAERKSLFVFDNAEKSEKFKQFLPLTLSRNDSPYVLITSRVARVEWEQWGIKEGITLDVFTEEQAVSFLKEALNIDKGTISLDNEIRKLAIDVLHQFPLALVQAVAHIKEENRKSQRRGKKEYTIVKYLEDYKKAKKILLDSGAFKNLDDDYTKTTLTTWKLTIDKIKGDGECGQLALKFLEIIAYLAPENIPVESVFLKLTEGKKEKLWKAVELLNRYSMIKLEQGIAYIHRLVQEVTRIHLVDEKREEETLRKALELIKSYDLETRVNSLPRPIIYCRTGGEEVSHSDKHATYIWSYACKYGKLIKDFYSAYGANANTPIHLLAIKGEKEFIDSILKNTEKGIFRDNKVNKYNRIGFAPIHTAALHGHKEIVKYLVEEQGVDSNFITHTTEVTAAYIATFSNQPEVVKYLVGEKGAYPDVINNNLLNLVKRILLWTCNLISLISILCTIVICTSMLLNYLQIILFVFTSFVYL